MTKISKRSIIVSAVLVIAMCLSIMAAGTYAWFTDTATVNVNKIVSGKLDVALYMQQSDGTWVTAEGETINFLKTDANGDSTVVDYDDTSADYEKVLWEPGATYETQKLKVVNEGNLALKFKIVVSNVDGDDKLNEVITWLVCNKNSATDATVSLDTMEEILVAPKDTEGDVYYFSLKGHMDENAGNEYQNLSIDNIAITVYATQASDEYDSFDNIYDRNATYSANITEKVTVETATDAGSGVITVKNTKTYNSANTLKVNGETVSAASVTIPAGVIVDSENATLTLSVVKQKSVDTNVTIADGTTAKTYEIKVDGVKANSGEMGVDDGNKTPLKITFYVGKGLYNPVVYHKDSAMTTENVGEDGTYSYNSETGMMTIYTATFSPFTVTNTAFFFTNGAVDTVVGTIIASGADVPVHAAGKAAITVNADITSVLAERSAESGDIKNLAIAVESCEEGTVVYIESGTYKNTDSDEKQWSSCSTDETFDLIYAIEGGQIVISGGTFINYTPQWTLDCQDNSGSQITVSGGSFYKFNPAFVTVGDNEIFVKQGYVVLKVSDDWYEVVSENDLRLQYATKYTGTKDGVSHGSVWYVANGVKADLESYYPNAYKAAKAE